MKNLKQNKGITMIALIITIVVMIILAAVAINFATNDEGVINRAEEAKEKQEYAAVKEKIMSQYQYETNGSLDLVKTKENINKVDGVVDIENIEVDGIPALKIILKYGDPIIITKSAKEVELEDKKDDPNTEDTTKPGDTTNSGDTTSESTDPWTTRGITNVTLDKVYVSEDGAWKIQLKSDGGLWQDFNGTIIDYNSEDLETMLGNGIDASNNVIESPSQGIVITFANTQVNLKIQTFETVLY